MTLALDVQSPIREPFAVAALAALRGRGALTLSELSKATQLSRPTILSGVNELHDRGWVERVEPVTSRGAGRPAMRFRFKAESAVVVGVDVGVHKVLVAISDLNERLLGQYRVDVEPALIGAMRVDAVVDAIHEALNEFAPSARLLAVGIGAPGIVDGLGRISVSRAIPEWDGIDLAGHLRQAFACPVFVENDAHAATLGEAYYGAGRGARTFAYLMAGYRISSGIVIGGKLHRGWSGASGMVGEMDILEWKTAPDALVARASAADANLGAALDVFSAAAGGDAAAQAAVDQYVDSLAVGLSALSLAIDPELIVVGGGTSMVGQPLADSLRERLSAHASIIHPRIEISTLEDQAVAMGGIRLAFDYVETSVFDLSAIARS